MKYRVQNNYSVILSKEVEADSEEEAMEMCTDIDEGQKGVLDGWEFNMSEVFPLDKDGNDVTSSDDTTKDSPPEDEDKDEEFDF